MLTFVDYKVELNLWIALSILIYAFSVNLTWRWRHAQPARSTPGIEKLRGWLLASWLLPLLRLAYYVGLPFCLLLNGEAVERSLRRLLGFSLPLGFLMRGVLLPRAMGLSGLSIAKWFAGVGIGIALTWGAFLMMAAGWWYCTRSVRELPAGQTASLTLANVGEPTAMALPSPTSTWWGLLWEAIYAEIHWAFYRAGPIVLLDNDYAGVFLGFLILSLEWWTNPAWRRGWDPARRRADVVLHWGLAFVMAIIFLFTWNLWLAIPLHWVMEMGLARIGAGENRG